MARACILILKVRTVYVYCQVMVRDRHCAVAYIQSTGNKTNAFKYSNLHTIYEGINGVGSPERTARCSDQKEHSDRKEHSDQKDPR